MPLKILLASDFMPPLKRLRYLLEAAFLRAFIRLLSAFSFEGSSDFGGWIARKLGPRLAVNAVAKRNLRFAFSDWTVQETNRCICAMWENLGRTAAEFPHMTKMDQATFEKYVTVEGFHHIQSLHSQSIPFICLAGHFANWELGPKLSALYGIPLALVYRAANNPYVNQIIQSHRSTYQLAEVPKGISGTRKMVSLLKQKKPFGMLLDQKMNDGVATPFFNRPAMTASAIASIVKKYHYRIIPSQIIRVSNTQFKVVVHPPLENLDRLDEKQLLLRINQIYESWIRMHPEQWFWVHKRWDKSDYSG